jgi:hypothetical protein
MAGARLEILQISKPEPAFVLDVERKPPNAKNLRLRLQALYLWKLDNCLTNFLACLILSPATPMF